MKSLYTGLIRSVAMPPVRYAKMTDYISQLFNQQYTPVLTHQTNIAASVAAPCQWARLGNLVMVFGSVQIQPTAGATATVLVMSLPILSVITNPQDVCGTAIRAGTATANQAANIQEFPPHSCAIAYFNDADVAQRRWRFSFGYLLV